MPRSRHPNQSRSEGAWDATCSWSRHAHSSFACARIEHSCVRAPTTERRLIQFGIRKPQLQEASLFVQKARLRVSWRKEGLCGQQKPKPPSGRKTSAIAEKASRSGGPALGSGDIFGTALQQVNNRTLARRQRAAVPASSPRSLGNQQLDVLDAQTLHQRLLILYSGIDQGPLF